MTTFARTYDPEADAPAPFVDDDGNPRWPCIDDATAMCIPDVCAAAECEWRDTNRRLGRREE